MYVFARAGPEKAVRPRMLKLQANLSPNWSHDKIVIEGQAAWENIWLSFMVHIPRA